MNAIYMRPKNLVVAVIAVFTLAGFGCSPSSLQTPPGQSVVPPVAPVAPVAEKPAPPPADTSHQDKIRVTSPQAGEAVTSPLVVTGEARGPWYFEASFPVKLLDADGKVLAAEPAQAQGDWMTDQFVPFRVSLTFQVPPAATAGTLVLEKDNPSGLPQNADEIRLPITFTAPPAANGGKPVSTATCAVENCHGMDIKCGSNPPDVCTEMYGIGDKCLKYAKCGVQNGQCQQIMNPQFTQCKACVQACVAANKNDNIKAFGCESKCDF